MTTDSHASPGDSSTGQLSAALAVDKVAELPVIALTDAVDLDGERRLAAAVFERAAADLEGGHGISAGRKQEREARGDAIEWAQEAGPVFRFWATLAGRDWRCARKALLDRRDRRVVGKFRWTGQ